MPEISIALALFASGILAGISNAIAGGGTFFTFPAFLSAGLPPVVANASNSIAVWPGHALAVIGYRRELRQFSKGVGGSIGVALLGGSAGALLLAYTGNGTFAKLIPFLILLATLLFAFGGSVRTWLTTRSRANTLSNPSLLTRGLEFLFALYGGFFGAGLGVMLMAGLLMLGVHDVQANNALKNLLASAVTSIAVILFIIFGVVSWPHTAIAFGGAVVGGLFGARIARALPAVWLQRIVISVGLVLSAYYFNKYYGG